MGPTPTLARRFWEAIEPIHAVVYFAPEPAVALRRIGLRGFWMGYFAGRVAPLGPVPSGPVAAMAYGFAPAMVERAIPDAWRFADPAAVVDCRIASAADALRYHLDRPAIASLAGLSGLLWEAIAGCRFEGLPSVGVVAVVSSRGRRCVGMAGRHHLARAPRRRPRPRRGGCRAVRAGRHADVRCHRGHYPGDHPADPRVE